jgi:hypothetical protein
MGTMAADRAVALFPARSILTVETVCCVEARLPNYTKILAAGRRFGSTKSGEFQNRSERDTHETCQSFSLEPRRNVETTDDWILSPVPMSTLGCGSTGQFNTMTNQCKDNTCIGRLDCCIAIAHERYLFDRPHLFTGWRMSAADKRLRLSARPIAVIQLLIGLLYGRASTAIESLNICSCPSSFLQIQIL